ncbi:response regulator transcription factor [Aggregicoccus sp. 17bor-14]|uniref:response regulator transcription factor n=1 Tax=Myxococcaceae TaxID=31 RepID=UPI00351A95B2
MAILEDQTVFRESLVAFLEGSGLEVLARCGDSKNFLARVSRDPPHVAVVDLWLERQDSPVAEDGLTVVQQIHDFHPQVRSLVLSGSRDTDTMERAFRAGASGFLCKLTASCDDVLAAVQAVANGERLMPPEAFPSPGHATNEPQIPDALASLTPREREVLGYVAAGADNLKIAAYLDITERTVKAHITSIYRKLGAENRTQMAMLACRLGVSRPLSV